MDINSAVAQNIKLAREQKKLTLDGAAALTGVSRSMLAQIERGDANPTVAVLWKIANGYKVPFTSLVEPPQECASLIRVSDAPPIREDGGRYLNYPVFCFDEHRQFETYRIVIAPGGGLTARPHLPGTEEYITVFDGAVEITAGEEAFSLSKGDSLRFRADIPHAYRNPGAEEAQLSMLIYYSA